MSISRKLIEGASGSSGGGGHVDDVFSTYLYEGTNADQDIENGIDLAGEGGMVWSKSRSNAYDHGLMDTERGVAGGYLQSNDPAGAGTDTPSGKDLTSFNSDGYSVGPKYTASWNTESNDYASWTFRKAPNFFDVVTYTGDGVAGREIPHGLGCEVGFAIVKRTDAGTHWYAQHKDVDLTGNKTLYLSLPGPLQVSNNAWNSTHATSENLIVGDHSDSNGLDGEYVAYLFAHDDSDESMISCGSYTGNQTAGNEVDLGFEPQFVLIKAASGTGDWYMFDTVRGIVTGGNDPFLRANMSAAESAAYEQLELKPTGFSLSAEINVNANGIEYIYIAIRKPDTP